MNDKRVERIWRRERLKMPARQPKRGRLWLADGSCIRLRPRASHQVWSYDFVEDRIHDGRKIRMLNVVDEFTHECLAIIGGNDQANSLDGGLGKEDLYGVPGDDVLIGGPGADLCHGGAGFDIVSYETSGGPVVAPTYSTVAKAPMSYTAAMGPIQSRREAVPTPPLTSCWERTMTSSAAATIS